MLKILTLCAALVLAAAAFSDSAEARKGGISGGGGGGVGMGAARVGSMGGVRSMATPGRMSVAPGSYGTLGNRGIYRAGIAPGNIGNRGIYRTGVASGYGQWQGKGNWSGGKWHGNRQAYWYGGRRHYGGYWPWLGVGAGLALAATGPYYGGYGYDDCVQWRPDWGWVNVCEYPYGGYYPY